MDVGDLWAMWLLQDYSARIFTNRHVFEVRSPSGSWQNDVFAAWQAGCQDAFKARRQNDWALQQVIFRDVVPGNAADVDMSFSIPRGTSFADGLPISCVLKLLWHTDLIGRSNKGCSYLSGYTVADQSFGDLTLGAGGAGQAYGQAMLDTFGPGGSAESLARFVVLSRRHDGVTLGVPVGTPVTSFVLQDDLRSQRRRRLD